MPMLYSAWSYTNLLEAEKLSIHERTKEMDRILLKQFSQISS